MGCLGILRAQGLHSGVYYPGLLLAVDHKAGIISGYFETYKNYNPVTGKPESYCRFFIKGSINRDSIRIRAYYPEWGLDTILGRFYMMGDSAFVMKLQSDPPCWSYVEDENVVYKGVQFDLDETTGWLELGFINKEYARIYPDYGDESLMKNIYVAKYKQLAKVLARRKGWLKVELMKDEENAVIGWIKESSFF